MDANKLLKIAQGFAPEGTTARLFEPKLNGTKASDYKGTIVAVDGAQALQKLNDKGTFVAHEADGLSLGDVVRITYANGQRTLTPYEPSALTLDDVLSPVNQNSGTKVKAAKTTKTSVIKGAKAVRKARIAKPVSASADASSDIVQSVVASIDAVEPEGVKRTMDDITNDIYQAAANRIVAAMEAGTSIWQKCWTPPSSHSRPFNAESGLNYQGINRVLLMCEMLAHEWTDTRFMTFKQVRKMADALAKEGVAKDKLPFVRKGSIGLPIYKLGFIEKKTPLLDSAGKPMLDADGKPKVKIVRGKSYMQTYTVFSASAIENLAPLPEQQAKESWEIHSEIEDLVSQLGVKVIQEPDNRCYYQPSTDTVTMAERAQFSSANDYYAVLLHEAGGHATGHESRLNRDLTGHKGDASYAYEELIAETSSAFEMASLGLQSDEVIKRHAAYLEGWKARILDDPRALFKAFSEAEKAADWFQQRHPIQLEAAAKLAVNSSPTMAVAATIGSTHMPPVKPVGSTDPWLKPTVPDYLIRSANVNGAGIGNTASFGMT